MNSKRSDRRRFLKDGAALAGLALGAAQSAGGQVLAPQTGETRPEDLHAYGRRSQFETAIRKGRLSLWPATGNRD